MKTIKITFYFFFGIVVGLLISDCCTCYLSDPIASGVPPEQTSTRNYPVVSTESIDPLPQATEQKNTFEKSTEPLTQSMEEIPVALSPIASLSDSTLKTWGTRQGLMEVSQDQALTNKNQSAIDQWGTREGLIEISNDETKDERLDTTSPKTDIQKWGTRELVIDVATDRTLTAEKLVKKMQVQRKLEQKAHAELTSQLRKFEVIQIAIGNRSDRQRAITLGGATISPPLPEDVADHRIVASANVGIHPQGVMVNPFNDLIYVANQLSDSVTVSTVSGDVITTIKLKASLPGANSPVALAVHSLAGKPDYGKVYVTGSVANVVSVINTSHEVTKEINTGVRPVAIAFHPLNEMLYVANLASGNVTVIDAVTEKFVTTLPAGRRPRAVSVNPENGDIYIANSGDNSITVYDQKHHFLTTIYGAGIEPASLAWHPGMHQMHVTAMSSAQLIPIHTDYTLGVPVPVGQKPYGMVYNAINNFLYIADKESNVIHVLNDAYVEQGSVSAPGVNIGFAIHPNQNILLYTNPFDSEMEIVGYAALASAVQVDAQELSSLINYFRYNPALIEHVKFIVSGDKGINNLVVLEKSISGKRTQRSIALSNYQSPQHFQKVYEVDALKNAMLNGHTEWHFDLPAGQAATILVYYMPFEKTKAYKNFNSFINQPLNA